MLNAFLDNKRVCSLDIKNIYGVKDYIVEKLLRDAGRMNKLTCEDCGALLYLKSGEVMIPHFAHKDRPRNCESYTRDIIESESHRMGVHTLYAYLKNNYINAKVEVDYRFENGRRANVYIDDSGVKLAVEYVYKVLDYQSWIDRNDAYNKLGINSVWILSDKELRSMQENGYDFFQKTMHMYSCDGIVRFFDYETMKVTFLKYLEYSVDGELYKRNSLSRSYDVSELEPSLKEVFSSEKFINYYEIEKLKFDIKSKADYDKKMALNTVLEKEKLKLREILKEENQAKENAREEKFKRSKAATKTEDEYCEEALKCRDENPNGPWYDSRGIERWAICVKCGSFTNEWWHINAKNECRCYCDSERDE